VICRDLYTVTGPLEELDAALEGRGPVTVADLVNFRPTVATHLSEPNGWSIVGLNTNFFTGTKVQVQDDVLLGIPASVRFTPVAFSWSYGDGDSVTSVTGGASWAELGLDEFDATGTSHPYPRPGVYQVDLSTAFAAEYRFGDSEWIAIEGTVSAESERLRIRASEASLVLVERDCTRRPSAPGC